MGILFNGTKYVKLCHNNELKKKSLYDNLYFTLKDIFLNSDTHDDCVKAAFYVGEITGYVQYEERTEDFSYVNMLDQKDFAQKLFLFFKSLNKQDSFEFSAPEEDDVKEVEERLEYIALDDWWAQYEHLSSSIEELLL